MQKLLKDELLLLYLWLFIGLFGGIVYAFARIGIDIPSTLMTPQRARALHISHMLYGFFPLILSLLPFALFEKDNVLHYKAIVNLRRYFVAWHTFLLFMTMSLIFGNLRGLPFYDFPYVLNFLLAFSGLFYLLALIDSLRRYEKRPLWVNISLVIVVIAPVLLVALMNPVYGQVEKTIIGPHGDNTLGMSFALIPIYYLLFKLVSSKPFTTRYAWLWIVPLAGYAVSLIIRNFFHPLSYNEEWFFQYLTLLYVPLLWIWIQDSNVTFNHNPYLWLSVMSFLFVDIEGNILFIPQIRALIHRNDLVIGHAHISMGVSVAFMALAIAYYLLPLVFKRIYALWYVVLFGLMALVLSIAGLVEAGILQGSIAPWMTMRILIGIAIVILLLHLVFAKFELNLDSKIKYYHLIGFLSDGVGGVILLLAAPLLFGLLGFHFSGTYEYVVFAFMIGIGIIHWFGLRYGQYKFAAVSATVRLVVSAVFLSLYLAGAVDMLGLLVALYDGCFALIYWLYLREDI